MLARTRFEEECERRISRNYPELAKSFVFLPVLRRTVHEFDSSGELHPL